MLWILILPRLDQALKGPEVVFQSEQSNGDHTSEGQEDPSHARSTPRLRLRARGNLARMMSQDGLPAAIQAF